MSTEGACSFLRSALTLQAWPGQTIWGPSLSPPHTSHLICVSHAAWSPCVSSRDWWGQGQSPLQNGSKHRENLLEGKGEILQKPRAECPAGPCESLKSGTERNHDMPWPPCLLSWLLCFFSMQLIGSFCCRSLSDAPRFLASTFLCEFYILILSLSLQLGFPAWASWKQERAIRVSISLSFSLQCPS